MPNTRLSQFVAMLQQYQGAYLCRISARVSPIIESLLSGEFWLTDVTRLETLCDTGVHAYIGAL